MHDGQGVELAGDRGYVLVTDGASAHVLWHTGALAGKVTLHAIEEFEGAQARGHIEASLDDSLEVGTLHFVSARQAYDESGASGVLEQMALGGQLDALGDITDAVYTLVTGRVRNSPYLRSITAQLDEEEAEAVVLATSAALLQSLLTPEEQ